MNNKINPLDRSFIEAYLSGADVPNSFHEEDVQYEGELEFFQKMAETPKRQKK